MDCIINVQITQTLGNIEEFNESVVEEVSYTLK